MSLILPSSLLKAIDQRKKEDAFRSLSLKNYIVDFYSNDYLGLAHIPNKGSMRRLCYRESLSIMGVQVLACYQGTTL